MTENRDGLEVESSPVPVGTRTRGTPYKGNGEVGSRGLSGQCVVTDPVRCVGPDRRLSTNASENKCDRNVSLSTVFFVTVGIRLLNPGRSETDDIIRRRDRPFRDGH